MSWLMIRGKVVKKTCPICGFDYAVMSYIRGVRTFKCCNCGEVVGGKVSQGFVPSYFCSGRPPSLGLRYPADDIKSGEKLP